MKRRFTSRENVTPPGKTLSTAGQASTHTANINLHNTRAFAAFICVDDELGVEKVCARVRVHVHASVERKHICPNLWLCDVAPVWTTLHLDDTVLWTGCHGNCSACAYKNKSPSARRHFDIYGAIFLFFFKHLEQA